MSQSFKDYKVIILPMSGINDNNIVKSLDGEIIVDNLETINKDATIFTGLVTEKMKKIDAKIISFLSYKNIKELNNKITCDGIEADIKEKNKRIITILGYGNIGKELYKRLVSKGINCIVGDIDESKMNDVNHKFNTENIEEFKKTVNKSSIVINTVPHNIINDEIISSFNDKVYILDIASYPHGINQKYVENLNYHLYLGIPGKYNPSESGAVLLKKVQEIIGG